MVIPGVDALRRDGKVDGWKKGRGRAPRLHPTEWPSGVITHLSTGARQSYLYDVGSSPTAFPGRPAACPRTPPWLGCPACRTTGRVAHAGTNPPPGLDLRLHRGLAAGLF